MYNLLEVRPEVREALQEIFPNITSESLDTLVAEETPAVDILPKPTEPVIEPKRRKPDYINNELWELVELGRRRDFIIRKILKRMPTRLHSFVNDRNQYVVVLEPDNDEKHHGGNIVKEEGLFFVLNNTSPTRIYRAYGPCLHRMSSGLRCLSTRSPFEDVYITRFDLKYKNLVEENIKQIARERNLY